MGEPLSLPQLSGEGREGPNKDDRKTLWASSYIYSLLVEEVGEETAGRL
jgi:hypothetical protein